jgi:hypothetical protein
MIVFPAVQPGDDIRLSASTFVAYRECPDYAKSRLEQVWGPDSVAGFKGGLAHQLFARHLTAGPIQPGDVAQVCREEIGASNLNHKLGPLGLKPSDLERVIGEVGALYDRFRQFPTDGFGGAEVPLEATPVEGVTLVGKVDAVFSDEEGTRLVDWKTGDLGDVADQLGFYALLWTLDRGALPAAVEAVSIRTGERRSSRPEETSIRHTAEQVAEMVDTVRAAWTEGRGIDRIGGPWCRYCGLLETCDEGRSATPFH